MYYKIGFSMNNYHSPSVFLPCFGNIFQDSIGFFISIEKRKLKTFLSAFSVLKVLTLSIFFLVLCIFGTHESFGQKAVIPDINAGVSGLLTCTNTSVKLKGNSKTLGVYYSWTGPRGFISTAQEPVTTMPGDYTLTVKDPLNGGTATAIVKVLVDTIAPAGIKATVSGLLTCKDTLVVLTGASSITRASFDWKGPKGFASAVKDPAAKTPGIYVLTVTNPANGCTSKANVRIGQNIVPPSGITATSSGMLTCNASSVTLTGGAATKDVHYRWSGPAFTSDNNKPNVSAPGSYLLEVVDPTNGCSSKASVTVKQDIAVPAQVTVDEWDTLTCKKAKATLSASSSTKSASFRWTGPQAFTSTEQSVETNTAGSFTVVVTNPENGCSVKKQVTVVRDTIPPVKVLATVSGVLSCKDKTVTVKGSSSSPKVTYAWTGPANFSAASANPTVSLPGRYEVIVAKIANGCSISTNIKVEQDTVAPRGVSASVSGSLSCKNPSVVLDGMAASKQVIFTWIGPQSFKANEKSPAVKIPGRYTLTVTNTGNGCMSNKTVIVAGNACTGNKQ